MKAAEFERRFAAALLGDTAPGLDGLTAQPGFAVYRNTALGGCIDALAAAYPAVHRLVGADWFRAAAAVFVRACPPCDGRLLLYGAGFAAFLDGFEPARALPYLAGVATLDRFWIEAHVASDAVAASARTLRGIGPADLAALRLVPHAAARWAWFDEHPVFSIWSRNRHEPAACDDPVWQGEGALVTRPGGDVRWCALDAAGCCLMGHLAQRRPLGLAAEMMLQAHPAADLAGLLALLLDRGALTLKGEPA